MAPRRFDASSDRQKVRPSHSRNRSGRRRHGRSSTTSRVLLGVIGAIVGAVVVLAFSGRLASTDRSTTSRRERRRRLALATLAHVAPLPATTAVADPITAEMLEDRVLEAFSNDLLLSRRAIDIGAIGNGRIELTGTVRSRAEVLYALTLARGVPAVDDVVDGLVVRSLV